MSGFVDFMGLLPDEKCVLLNNCVIHGKYDNFTKQISVEAMVLSQFCCCCCCCCSFYKKKIFLSQF